MAKIAKNDYKRLNMAKNGLNDKMDLNGKN